MNSSALAGCFGLLRLTSTLGLVGFDLGTNALLGLQIVGLLLSLLGGFFNLLLACKLFLLILRISSRFLTDFLHIVSKIDALC